MATPKETIKDIERIVCLLTALRSVKLDLEQEGKLFRTDVRRIQYINERIEEAGFDSNLWDTGE